MAAIQAALAAEENSSPAPAPAKAPAPSATAKPRSAPLATAPAAAAAATTIQAASEDIPVIYHEHADGLTKEQVDAMLAESHDFRKKRKARQRVLVNMTIVALFLGLIGGAFGWYAVSPDNQAKVHGLWGNVTDFTSGRSKESLSDIIDSYDESLDKIATRGEQVRVATVALGADPDAVDPEGDAALAAAMKEMSGGETTSLERDALLRQEMGGVAEILRAKIDADREKKAAEERAAREAQKAQ
ncbi:MAG: hypothetical protein O3A87_10565 [Verrucomicrobia bacterium]|nr:hypothetical protein [Verrucomicrobiota bacterium]